MVHGVERNQRRCHDLWRIDKRNDGYIPFTPEELEEEELVWYDEVNQCMRTEPCLVPPEPMSREDVEDKYMSEIPKFHFPTAKWTGRLDVLRDLQPLAQTDADDILRPEKGLSTKSMRNRFNKEVRQKMLSAITQELLTEDDLHRLLDLLKECAKEQREDESDGLDDDDRFLNIEMLRSIRLLNKLVQTPTLGKTDFKDQEERHEIVYDSETINYEFFQKCFTELQNAAQAIADLQALAGESSEDLDNQIGKDKSSKKDAATMKKKFAKFFSTGNFFNFGRSRNGCIAIVPFFTYVVRKINIKQTRIQLSYYDTSGHGYLREKDMENFVFELIPTLPQLHTLQEEFYPFYVFTAVRKFFFYLDYHRSGKIYIRDLLSSTILPELYELRQDSDDDMNTNWFSVASALKVYSSYLELDQDQNGMLQPQELAKYGSGMLTDVFIQRVFEEYQTYRDDLGCQEMDYKTFLDFVLAMENKGTKQSMMYFWRLVDMNHNGKLDTWVINYFFRSIVKTLEQKELDSGIRADDVKDEIFDMVKPKNPNYITMEDLLECKVGGTVISMLVDTQAFWHYDNRETLMMTL